MSVSVPSIPYPSITHCKTRNENRSLIATGLQFVGNGFHRRCYHSSRPVPRAYRKQVREIGIPNKNRRANILFTIPPRLITGWFRTPRFRHWAICWRDERHFFNRRWSNRRLRYAAIRFRFTARSHGDCSNDYRQQHVCLFHFFFSLRFVSNLGVLFLPAWAHGASLIVIELVCTSCISFSFDI